MAQIFQKFLFIIFIQITFSLKSETVDLKFHPERKFFTVPIHLGSNGKEFEVQVDTCTSETWVPSKNSTVEGPHYDSSESKTSLQTNKEFEVQDTYGNVKGISTYDQMTFGQFSVNKMGFIQVSQFEVGFRDFKQGKLGLGYKQEHGIDFNLVGLLKKTGVIEKEMFSIVPESNQLIIGDYPHQFDGELYTTCNLTETDDLDDVYRAGWVCEMTHIFFAVDTKNKSLEMAFEVNARVIFDSGYPYISMPRRHLDDFNKKFMQEFFSDSCIEIKEKNEIYFVCDDDEKIPRASMAFVIGGYGYVIPWDKLFYRVADDKYELLIRFQKENDDIFSFGYPFVNQFSLVYNYEDKVVGFYQGERIDLSQDWDEYMNGQSPLQKKERMKKLILIGSIIGVILLLVIICLIVRSNKKERINKRGETQKIIANENL